MTNNAHFTEMRRRWTEGTYGKITKEKANVTSWI